MPTTLVILDDSSVDSAPPEPLITFYPPWFKGPRYEAPPLSEKTRAALEKKRQREAARQ